VTHLNVFLRHQKKFRNSAAYRNYIVSDDWTVMQGSPAQNIDKINIPVLLLHGDKDRRVRVKQSRIFRDEMEDEKKNITYFEFEGGDHHLSQQKHRIKFLQEVGKFLGKYL
jgi:dipeptidyl aminopeptidase/acylaminoacyl peptidase